MPLLLIAISYGLEVIFTWFEFDEKIAKKWHPYYDGHTYSDGSVWNGWVTDAVYYYGFFEIAARAVIFLAVGLIIYFRHWMPLLFFMLCAWEIADAIDYHLTRNDLWFTFHGGGNEHRIEYNFIKIILVLFSLIYELERDLE